MKKLRMLYGHVTMWNIKMEEVNRTDTERVDQPLPFKDINHKKSLEANGIQFRGSRIVDM